MTPINYRAALLRALTTGPAIGAQLIRRISRLTAGRLKLGDSAAYLALQSLEAEGLIRECTTDEQRVVQPRHRWFELTRQGRSTAEDVRVALAGLSAAAHTPLRERGAMPTPAPRDNPDQRRPDDGQRMDPRP